LAQYLLTGENLEHQEHRKIHLADIKPDVSWSEKISSTARELYDSLTSGMKKAPKRSDKTVTDNVASNTMKEG